jgi:hypothetical protein
MSTPAPSPSRINAHPVEPASYLAVPLSCVPPITSRGFVTEPAMS